MAFYWQIGKLDCFVSGRLQCQSHHVSLCVCYDENSSWLVFLAAWCHFVLSWPWHWVFFCVCVSPAVSCLRLARISEPPQAPSPSSLTTSSQGLLPCPVQTCIIYPPACLLLCASRSSPLESVLHEWTWGQVMCCQYILMTSLISIFNPF